MGRILTIRDKELSDILDEGIALIYTRILTGFNFDKETSLAQLELVVQYYHNVEQHISKFLNKIQEGYINKFSEPLHYEISKKWGLLRWLENFDDEPGNKYYTTHENILATSRFLLERIPYEETIQRIDKELILAKDKSYIVNLEAKDGTKARFLIDFVKKHCTTFIRPNNTPNPDRIDKHTHIKPLYILTDKLNQVKEKSDLELVYQLKLTKNRRIISTLIQKNKLEKILEDIVNFQCKLIPKIEEKYVDKEFFINY
ncbi:hypothetical protein HY498_03780 [Candidatus Woesearchaeota archaeon]|nr:hypothetical protein [Candidatus Woesearchaeota archaeon]